MIGTGPQPDSSNPDVAQAVDSLVEAIQDRRRSVNAAEVPGWLVSAHLAHVLMETGATPALRKRIGEGRFVAFGLLASVGLSLMGGFLIHPAAASFPLWKLKRLLYWDRTWRPHLLALYVQLEGDDALVFEAVHFLATRAIVVNYDAIAARNFDDAFGTDPPTADQVVSAVALESERVHRAIHRLLAVGVLKSDGASFRIAF